MGDEVTALNSSLSRQHQKSRQLRSQLDQLHGTLKHRVTRLASSVQALVELTDLQLVLALSGPPALVRHRAKAAITEILSDGQPPCHSAEDFDGYWLGPAVAALVALLRGEEASEPLAAAEARDRDRTALLLTCGLAAASRGGLADRWLPTALGECPAAGSVTYAQRTVWMSAAAGRFGVAGTATLRRWLADLVGGLTPAQEQVELDAWARMAQQLRTSLPLATGGMAVDPAVQQCLTAGGKLAALRELCCPPAPDVAAEPTPDDPVNDQLVRVLHSLVDEGTAEEAPLLRRAVELRTIIRDGKDGSPPVQWDDPAGKPVELLRQDAFTGSGGLAEHARVAAGRWLRATAERLAAAAAHEQSADATISTPGGQVRVRPTGPDGWDISRVRAAIQERPVIDPRADKTAYGWAAAGTGVGLTAALLPGPAGFLALLAGVGLLATGARRWLRERRARQHRIRAKEEDLAAVTRAAERTAAGLTELHRQLAEAAQQANADLAEIRTRLPG